MIDLKNKNDLFRIANSLLLCIVGFFLIQINERFEEAVKELRQISIRQAVQDQRINSTEAVLYSIRSRVEDQEAKLEELKERYYSLKNF